MDGRIRADADSESINVLGIPHILHVRGAETGGQYEIMVLEGEPGRGVPPHVHSGEEETFHVVAGSVRFRVGDDEVLATAGTTVHLPRGVTHGFTFEGDTPSRLLLVIAPAGLEPMLRELAALPEGAPDPARISAICAPYGITFAPPPPAE